MIISVVKELNFIFFSGSLRVYKKGTPLESTFNSFLTLKKWKECLVPIISNLLKWMNWCGLSIRLPLFRVEIYYLRKMKTLIEHGQEVLIFYLFSFEKLFTQWDMLEFPFCFFKNSFKMKSYRVTLLLDSLNIKWRKTSHHDETEFLLPRAR